MKTRGELLSLKQQAINYRISGFSYGLINEKMHVSKSTLSGWLRNIPYKPNIEAVERIKSSINKSANWRKARKLRELEEVKRMVAKELFELTKRDLWMVGIGLYMGEGSKGGIGGVVRITNSDPEIIKLAITWFKNIYGVSKRNFRISIHTHPDCNIEDTVNFWSKTTGIAKDQFGKTYIDGRKKSKTKSVKKLYRGTAYLNVRANGNKEYGMRLFRRIIRSIEVVKLNFNAGMV